MSYEFNLTLAVKIIILVTCYKIWEKYEQRRRNRNGFIW